MSIEIGRVEAIFRYPVKSMAGERLESANLGWHGIDGDRRLALRRVQDRSGFPWLSASKLPDLLRFVPVYREDGAQANIPSHVRTPEGEELPVFGEELCADIERRHGASVQMLHLRDGIFDDANVSVITAETVEEIARLAETRADVRRFRPNIVVRLNQARAFHEVAWLGGVLSFGDGGDGGDGDDAPRISITMNDVRCSMVNFDPDTARATPAVLKSIVRANDNNAGVYGTIVRCGRLTEGQTIRFEPS